MANIMKHVDALELVSINVFKGRPIKGDECPIVVTVDPLDTTKKVVFDEDALRTFNARLTEKVKNSNSQDPNTVMYIKEFVGKMFSELYRNRIGLY